MSAGRKVDPGARLAGSARCCVGADAAVKYVYRRMTVRVIRRSRVARTVCGVVLAVLTIMASAGPTSAQPAQVPLAAPVPMLDRVLAHPLPTTKATLRPVGSRPLSDARAAARVARRGWEPRPQNFAANHRVPTAEELAGFHRAQAALGEWDVNPYAQQVTGNFTGTTDEIIQWAAHKWGIDEDIVRAVAVMESEWKQEGVHADSPHFSYGILQVLNEYAGTFPLSRDSTAFNADFYGAHIRFVFDGLNRWFNDVPHGRTYGPGDIWGSVGSWFAGAWWTPEATAYVDGVKGHLANRIWEQAGF